MAAAAVPSSIPATAASMLDFISGYCVHNIGHNHPRLVAALKAELDAAGPAMLQSHVSDLAGELAGRLCRRAGGRLAKAFFASSGSEGIETVIKFARAHTGRSAILYAADGFHGLTCGALSLMSNPFWKERFGPMLPGTEPVPFGDLEALQQKLAGKSFAAFVLEPVQAESGVLVPAERLPAQGPGAVPALRHALRPRRGPDRPLPHRRVPGGASFRRRARHGRARQGAQRRAGAVRARC